MSKIHVTTQYLENYGAHSESGKFADNNACWKFKGGNSYIIGGTSRAANAVAFVAALLQNENSIYGKEFPATWEEVDDDFLSPDEKLQIEYEGSVKYPASRHDLADYFKSGEKEISF